uniref:Uncharacterized protein n=1 Tax=Solanum tuberosum TaxID=4113 RepID=M1ARX6_SOLTU
MSGVSRVKSMNVVDSEARAILVPAVNLVVLLVGRSNSRRNLKVLFQTVHQILHLKVCRQREHVLG